MMNIYKTIVNLCNGVGMIYVDGPKNWQDLERRVEQIMLEVGCRAERGRTIKTVRGTAEIDVHVVDDSRNPQQTMLFECKNWNRAISKNAIHSFRTVVSDSGANVGYFISRKGYQSGAKAAAESSNIILLTWEEFQEHFYDRWLGTVSNHLMFICDRIYELTSTDEEDRHFNRLAYEAEIKGSEDAWKILKPLDTLCVAFSLGSSLIGGAGPSGFIEMGMAPDLETNEQLKHRASPRETVDAMFAAAPTVYSKYVEYLMTFTNGECGDVSLFDEKTQLDLKGSSKKQIEKELGSPRWISNWLRPNEKLHYNASKTKFGNPIDPIADLKMFEAWTEEISIEMTFKSDQSVDEFHVGLKEYSGLPY